MRGCIAGLLVLGGCLERASADPPRAGVYLAVWDDDRFAGTHGRRAVFGARIAADGTVLDPGGLAIEDRFTAFATQPIAVATTAGWLAAWERLDSDHERRPTEIWARRIRRDASSGQLLAVSGIGRHHDAQAAAAGDDVLVVWWRVDPPTVQASLIIGDQPTRLDFGKPQMSVHPGVAFDDNANVWLIVWRDALGGISGTRVDRAGKLLDRPFLVIAKGQKPRWDLGPRVASNGDGEFFVTWATGDDQSILGVLVDSATGKPLAQPAPLASVTSSLFRHAVGATAGGYALAWIDMPKGPRTLSGLWISRDGRTSQLPLPSGPGIGYSPAFQSGAGGLLASWHQSPEPRAARIDPGGRVDAQAITLRSTATVPVPAATLAAGLDDVSSDGADYCGRTRDRTLPGVVTGVLLEEGRQPWGWLHAPGFGWGYPPAGIEPGWSFHVGRDWAFAPKLAPRPGAKGATTMAITVPDENRHRVVQMDIEHASRDAFRAAGADGPISLVEVEVNGGLGSRGPHFVMTKLRVLESPAVLAARLAKLRRRFDATVGSRKPAMDRLLDAEDRKLKASIKHPIRSKLPRDAMVVYDATWRPSTRRLEVMFGYKIDGGYVVDLPRSDDGYTKREARPAGPAPVRYSIYMGVRYTLDGDRVESEAQFPPRAPTRQAPWECAAPEPARAR